MKSLEIRESIIFENEDFLAINKPAGIATLDDRADVVNILALAKGMLPEIQVCHRLDKDTSGVLVMAKNPESYRHLSLQFQNREVVKIYHAVAQGQTDFDNFKVEVPLIVKSKGLVKWDTKLGKPSTTFFTTLENYKACSLLECKPVTGRRHQIRVHLKYAKHPIVSDTMYEGEFIYLSQIKRKYKPGRREETPMISRVALHAFSISFKSLDGNLVQIEAPYPRDYTILLKQLEKYGK